MHRAYHIHDPTGLYYLTLQVVDWVDIFTRKIYCDIIIDSLKFCRNEKGLKLWSYVIMSNHLHLIISTENGNLSSILRDFKRHTSTHILETRLSSFESRRSWMKERFELASQRHSRNQGRQFWTHKNHVIQLWSEKWILQKLNYIHNNPVKAGMVGRPEDWMYSSARNYCGLKSMMPIDLLDVVS